MLSITLVQLGEKDVRDLVQLIGRIAVAKGGPTEKKRVLMEGLCKLIKADAWFWSLLCQREPSKPQAYVSHQYGGFTEQDLVKVIEASEHPQMIPITAKFFLELEREKTHLTRLRFQITDREEFMRTKAHDVWKAANIGPVIFSVRPLDERSSSTVVFYRHYDRDEFSARDSRIAHIVLSEVAWLHEQGWPEDRGVSIPKLHPRQRMILNLLILGLSRKQIAHNMGISLNTVQGYVKDVYRFFKVNSQPALMKRFLQGNGRDRK